jgi:hypothetical protein
MNLLAGHPLAMRLILPKLEKRTATDVVTALTTSGDEAQDKLYATLKFAEQSLPGQFRPLLTPLALHEGFLDANDAEQMAHQAIPGMILARVTSGKSRAIAICLPRSALAPAREFPGQGYWARSLAAVLGPICGTPGMLSLESPTRAR